MGCIFLKKNLIILSEKCPTTATLFHEAAHGQPYANSILQSTTRASKKILRELTKCTYHHENLKKIFSFILTIEISENYTPRQYPKEIHAELMSIMSLHPKIKTHLKKNGCQLTLKWLESINSCAEKKIKRHMPPTKRATSPLF